MRFAACGANERDVRNPLGGHIWSRPCPRSGDFGAIILAISAGVMLAVLARKLSERYPIPAPALFLLVAAAIPVVVPDIAQSSGSASSR